MTPERMEELFKGCPSCDGNFDEADCLCPSADEVRYLVTELREHEASFELRWATDQRAIEEWRKEHPEDRALLMPDHKDLCMWLFDRALVSHECADARLDVMHKQQEEIERLKEQHDRLMLRVRALLSWAPKTDPNRQWIEEQGE